MVKRLLFFCFLVFFLRSLRLYGWMLLGFIYFSSERREWTSDLPLCALLLFFDALDTMFVYSCCAGTISSFVLFVLFAFFFNPHLVLLFPFPNDQFHPRYLHPHPQRKWMDALIYQNDLSEPPSTLTYPPPERGYLHLTALR